MLASMTYYLLAYILGNDYNGNQANKRTFCELLRLEKDKKRTDERNKYSSVAMNGNGRFDSPALKRKIRDEVLLIRQSEPGISARGIRIKLAKLHPDSKYIPKERAIQKHIQKHQDVLDKASPSELDKPWSIGCFEKFNIPGHIAPILLQIKLWRSDPLTIREARWAVALYDIAREKMYHHDYKNKEHAEDQFRANFDIIISVYAFHERMAELKGESYLDTTKLDSDYFLREETFRRRMLEKGYFEVEKGRWRKPLNKKKDGEQGERQSNQS